MMIKRVDPADFGRDLHQQLLSHVPWSLIRKNLEQGQTHTKVQNGQNVAAAKHFVSNQITFNRYNHFNQWPE